MTESEQDRADPQANHDSIQTERRFDEEAASAIADEGLANLTTQQFIILAGSILVVALCGIAYELIISAVSSYLLGNSVFQFSITIGSHHAGEWSLHEKSLASS